MNNVSHYGCNSNGEHERCDPDSCGWYDHCDHRYQQWFLDRWDIPLSTDVKKEALQMINKLSAELEELKRLLEMK